MFSGLTSARRAETRNRPGTRQARLRRQRKLVLETLEDRRLLATFVDDSPALNIDLNAASENVSLVSNGTSYTLTLNVPNLWSGTNTANVTGSGTGTLTVTAAGLAAFSTIAITDSASGCGVTFNTSGVNAYSDNFSIVLDSSPAGAITFNGASSFGTNSLSASTTAGLVVSAGASVTASTGTMTFTADSVDISGTITANGGITLQPATLSRTIGLNDAAGDFNLTATELGRLASTGTATIGAAGGTGAISVGGSGAVNLSGEAFAFTVRGGDMTFASLLRIPDGKTLTLDVGQVTSAPGAGGDVRAGTLWLATDAAVGAAGNPLTTNLDYLRGTVGGDLFIVEDDLALEQVRIADELSAGASTAHFLGGNFILHVSNCLADASTIDVDGATFALGTNSDTVGGVTLTNGTISGSGVLTSLSDFELMNGTVDVRLAGNVGLNKTAPGSVALGNSGNTFTGPTTISEGTLTVGADGCLGTPPGVPAAGHLVIDGGTLAVSTNLTLAPNRGVTLGSSAGAGAGTFSVPLNFALTYNGIITDNGSGGDRLVLTGGGRLNLGGLNTYSGGAAVNQSQLRIAADSALGAVPASATPGHLILNGGELQADATFELAANRGIALGDPGGPGAGTITVLTGALGSPYTLTYDGIITDNGSGADLLIKKGLGILILGGANTYSGGTEFADEPPVASEILSTIQMNHPNALGTTGTVNFSGDSVLRYGPGVSTDLSGRLSASGPLVTATFDPGDNDVTWGTEMSFLGRLKKLGDGTLTFAAPGETQISVLYVLGGGVDLPTGTLRLTGSAPDTYGDTSVFLWGAELRIAGGTLIATESLQGGYSDNLTSPWKIDLSSGSLQVGGDLITKLSDDPNHAAFTVSGGTAHVSGDCILGFDTIANAHIRGGDVTVDGDLIVGRRSASKLDVSGGTVTADSLRHEQVGDKAVVTLTGGLVTVDEVVNETQGETLSNFEVNLDAGGTLVTDRIYLNRTGGTSGTHTLDVRFDGGLLRPKSDPGSAPVVNLIDDFVIAPGAGFLELHCQATVEDGGAFNDIPKGQNAHVLRPVVHDATLGATPDGGLTKQGAGTLTLNYPDNTYTGETDIVAGTLALAAASVNNIPASTLITVHAGAFLDVIGLDSNTIALANGQTLQGHGRVNGQVNARLASTVSPGIFPDPAGTNPGRLTTDGAAFQAESNYLVDIEGRTAGSEHDQLRVFGAVDIQAGAFLQTPGMFLPSAGDEFIIIDNDGTGADDAVTLGTDGRGFNNLREGEIYDGDFRGTGLEAIISYRGGDGNDVVLKFQPPPWTGERFDFNGFYAYTAEGWIPVSPFQSKEGSFYGWLTLPPYYYERNYPELPRYSSPEKRLEYDGQSTDYMGGSLIFEVDVVPGKQYEVMILTGDMLWNHDREQFQVYDANGVEPPLDPDPADPRYTQVVDTWGAGPPDGSGVTVGWGGGTANPAAGYYRWLHFTTDVIEESPTRPGVGTVRMRMKDLGGYDPATTISAMDVRAVERVGPLTITRSDPADTATGTPPSFTALPTDGVTVDTYQGTGAPPDTKLTVTVSAGLSGPYATITTDVDVTLFGGQVMSDSSGNFTFSVRRPAILADISQTTENWTITVEEYTGLYRGTVLQPYTTPSPAEPLRFDFGVSGSPLQTYLAGGVTKNFLPVIPQTIYNGTRGYGWLSRVAGVDRKDKIDVNPDTGSDLRRDLNYAKDATFRVDLPDGYYSLRIYHSNPKCYGTLPYVADNFDVLIEEGEAGATTYHVDSILAGRTTIWKTTSPVRVSNGALTVRLVDRGGQDGNFVIAGLDISAGVGLPDQAPLLAAGDPRDGGAAAISLAQLQPVVSEAAAQWTATGLTAAQAATLANVQFAVADLGGAYLGLAAPATNTVRIDDDAAMIGWSLVTGQWSLDNGQRTNDQGPMTSDGIDLLTVVLHEIGHLLGYEHTADGLMAPVLSASSSPYPVSRIPYPESRIPYPVSRFPYPESRIPNPVSRIPPPASRPDDVFAELGRGGSETPSSVLPESQDGEVLASATVKASEEAAQSRNPRRSRLPRYEQELDEYFAQWAGQARVWYRHGV